MPPSIFDNDFLFHWAARDLDHCPAVTRLRDSLD
jgi:hypothetical protein